MHPAQWLVMRLLRDGSGGTVGQYLGGGPFTGAYGNGPQRTRASSASFCGDGASS